jgi:hypothetical protein
LTGDRGADRTDPTDGPAVLRYLDVVAPLLAAPVVLALGAPMVGYALGVAAWILVRAFGIAADRRANSITNVAQQVSLRLAYRFTRVSLLVAVAILAFKGQGRADGVTALLVITFGYDPPEPFDHPPAAAPALAELRDSGDSSLTALARYATGARQRARPRPG